VHAKPEAAVESRHRGNRLAAEGLAHQTDKSTIPFAAKRSSEAGIADASCVAMGIVGLATR